MSLWHVFIPLRAPSLNEGLHRGKSRSGHSAWSHAKRVWREHVHMRQMAGLRPVADDQVHWGYLALEPSCRRDPSNIVSSAIKLAEDALQSTRPRLMAQDNWDRVRSIQAAWALAPSAVDVGVHVWAGASQDEVTGVLRERWELAHDI